MIGPTNRNNWLAFGADLVPDTDSKSLSTLLNTEEYRILGDLVAFFLVSAQFLWNLVKWLMPTRLWILNILGAVRLRINSAIQIGIPDHFWLKFCHWRRFALSGHSVVDSKHVHWLRCLVCGSSVGIYSSVHLQLHLDVWNHQRSLHAEPSRSTCLCLLAVSDSQQDHRR